MSFHLSHQPPLYVSIYFLLHELVQLVLILLHEIKSTRTQVVDGSNESLEHADEDLDTLLQKYSPLQKIFKKSSVLGFSFLMAYSWQSLVSGPHPDGPGCTEKVETNPSKHPKQLLFKQLCPNINPVAVLAHGLLLAVFGVWTSPRWS